jgi:adenylate cyclase
MAIVLSISDAAPVWLNGLLFDGGVAVRAQMSSQPVSATQVAVIAVDPESLDSPGLRRLPRAFFGPIWGQLITDLAQAGAKVVAFDFLLSYSANQFQKNYDRPFMAALYKNRSRVVLGRSASNLPARNYLAALRNDADALGAMDMAPNADEVYRNVPSTVLTENGDALPSLVGAALKRAGSETALATIRLAPNAHPETIIPTYGLATVLACAKKDPAALQAAFDGRVVFVGSTMPEENRKTTSSRFLAPSTIEEKQISPCGLRKLPASVPGASNVPGVHLHAIAAEAVLTNRLTKSPKAIWPAALAGLSALAGAAAGFVLAPLCALAGVIAIALLLWGGEIIFLAAGGSRHPGGYLFSRRGLRGAFRARRRQAPPHSKSIRLLPGANPGRPNGRRHTRTPPRWREARCHDHVRRPIRFYRPIRHRGTGGTGRENQ